MFLVLLVPSLLCGACLLVVAIECFAAFLGPRKEDPAAARRPTTAILVPAHNEESVLGATLASLLPQAAEGDRVLVVADNCTDGTAMLACSLGAEVIERNDLGRMGKSYALDFAVRHLAVQAVRPEVVVVVDADTPAAPGAVEQLARTASQANRPVQGTYLLEAPPGNPRLRIAEFTFAVRNRIRPAGLGRLGLPCLLNGSGMAFPWQILRSVDLASGRITEDRWLTVDLALRGHFVKFCGPALVTGAFPTTGAAIGTQRERWEHGHLETLLRQGPRLVAAALVHRSVRLMALALELCVPPLSLLLLAGVVILAADVAFGIYAGRWLPLLVCAIPGALTTVVLILHWRKAGGFPLWSAARFVLAKVPLYLQFAGRRQKRWISTARDPRIDN